MVRDAKVLPYQGKVVVTAGSSSLRGGMAIPSGRSSNTLIWEGFTRFLGFKVSRSTTVRASSIQIDEHPIVLYASPSEPWLIVPESVGKTGQEWLSNIPIESFLGVWTTGNSATRSAQPQISPSRLSCIMHVTFSTSHWLERVDTRDKKEFDWEELYNNLD